MGDRYFRSGRRAYDDGLALPLGCSGDCNQGRMPCDCELACDIAPDAERVIKAPTRTPEDMAAIARVRRWAVVIALASMAFLAALLKLAGARSFN